MLSVLTRVMPPLQPWLMCHASLRLLPEHQSSHGDPVTDPERACARAVAPCTRRALPPRDGHPWRVLLGVAHGILHSFLVYWWGFCDLRGSTYTCAAHMLDTQVGRHAEIGPTGGCAGSYQGLTSAVLESCRGGGGGAKHSKKTISRAPKDMQLHGKSGC